MSDPTFDLDIDSSDIDANQLDAGGSVNREGWYHFEITDLRRDGEEGKTPSLVFICQVLAGKPDDQVGKKLYHRLYLSQKEGGRRIILKFACGLGLITREQITDTQTRIPFSLSVGRQFVAEVKLEKGTPYDDADGVKQMGKDRYVIPFSQIYDPLDEAVANVPKDSDAIASLRMFDDRMGGGTSNERAAATAGVPDDDIPF